MRSNYRRMLLYRKVKVMIVIPWFWLLAAVSIIFFPEVTLASQWSWSQAPGTRPGGDIRAVAYADQTWRAVTADGKIWKSLDNGQSWVVEFGDNQTVPGLREITAVGSVWHAVGDDRVVRQLSSGAWSPKDRDSNGNFSKTLFGVAGSSSRVVAVGFDSASNGSTLARYFDGGDWSPGTVKGGKRLSSVAYGMNRFVAVGDDGFTRHSADGKDWTPASSGVTNALRAIVFTGSEFVAVGDKHVLATANGTTWGARVMPTANTKNLQGVAFGAAGGKPQLVVVGLGSVIYASEDAGRSWISGGLSGGIDFQDVAYGNGRFVAVGANGAVYFSDGPYTPSAAVSGVPGEVPATGATGRLNVNVTPDFVEWEARVISDPGGMLSFSSATTGLKGDRGLDFAVARNLGVARGATVGIFETTGGKSSQLAVVAISQAAAPALPNWGWVEVTPNVGRSEWIGGQWNVVAKGGGRWMALSKSGKVATADHLSAATQWVLQDLDVGREYWDLVHNRNNSLFVVAGAGRVRASADSTGTSFKPAAFSNDSVTFYGLAYDADLGRYVAVGKQVENGVADGVIYSGEKLGELTPKKEGSGKTYFDVAYGNGRFVAVGEAGVIRASAQGGAINWQGPTTGVQGRQMRKITHGDGQFVAVGQGGHVARSVDGMTWQTAKPANGIPSNVDLKGVAWGFDHYLAVGSQGGAGSKIYASQDAVHWFEASPFYHDLKDIGSFPGDYQCDSVSEVLVALGEDGRIFVSYGPGDYNSLAASPSGPLAATADANAGYFVVATKSAWTARVVAGETWLSLPNTAGSPCQPVHFAWAANPSPNPRSGKLLLSNDRLSVEVVVNQPGAPLIFTVTPEYQKIKRAGETISLTVEYNLPGTQWAAAIADSGMTWIKPGVANGGKQPVTFPANDNPRQRNGYLNFFSPPGSTNLVGRVKFTQAGTDPRSDCETPDILAQNTNP